jgi:hypothetical protein
LETHCNNIFPSWQLFPVLWSPLVAVLSKGACDPQSWPNEQQDRCMFYRKETQEFGQRPLHRSSPDRSNKSAVLLELHRLGEGSRPIGNSNYLDSLSEHVAAQVLYR